MDNKNEGYLYHYTSIETLLLILKNKTIAFNSLQNVDDLEESDSKDIKQIGKICYVSCWTKDSTESIPMWNMYTPNMQGVRIRLKEYPFKKYHYSKGEYGLKEDTDTYINYEKLYQEDKAYIHHTFPKKDDVKYTNDDDKIYPKIKNVVEELEETLSGEERWLTKVEYLFEELGRYKRENWDFQKETRYIINILPFSTREFKRCKSQLEQNRLIYRMEDIKIKAPYNLYFLELSQEALNDVEILLAPKVNEAQEEMIRLIVKEFCPNAKIIKSKLKIR